jgi:hypothetical protein
MPELHRIGMPHYLQQDGAPPHFAIIVREWLDHHFPDRWIGRGGPILWAPRSPDLTPLDFFLWGYLKHRVFQHTITNLGNLMETILLESKKISPQQLVNALKHFDKRMEICILANGGLFEHLIKIKKKNN